MTHADPATNPGAARIALAARAPRLPGEDNRRPRAWWVRAFAAGLAEQLEGEPTELDWTLLLDAAALAYLARDSRLAAGERLRVSYGLRDALRALGLPRRDTEPEKADPLAEYRRITGHDVR